MKIRVIAVGKIKEREVRALLEDYYGRIARATKIEEVELRDFPDERQMAEAFEKRLVERERVVALDAAGVQHTSAGLAKMIERHQLQGVQGLAFLVGGAYGLPKATMARADEVLSLSAMTFPHRLCRLVLAEQVYRAYSIIRGEPYDH